MGGWCGILGTRGAEGVGFQPRVENVRKADRVGSEILEVWRKARSPCCCCWRRAAHKLYTGRLPQKSLVQGCRVEGSFSALGRRAPIDQGRPHTDCQDPRAIIQLN